jgi:hypothetical protein
MSTCREAWLCVLQDADGNEEMELIMIERGREDAAPVIEVTNGVRITCTQPATSSATGAGRLAALSFTLSCTHPAGAREQGEVRLMPTPVRYTGDGSCTWSHPSPLRLQPRVSD